MELDFQKLYSLLYGTLVMESPVLSGNMQSLIQLGYIGSTEANIIIEAPFYDMKLWKDKKVVVHTGKNKKGKTDYASSVNAVGGFGSHNKSENWVNRVCYDVCKVIAEEIGAEVINKLPL